MADPLGPLTSLYAFSVLPLGRRTTLLAALVVCTMWSALAVGWGQHGFALMVFFDQVGYLIPAVVISTAIARTHGRGGDARGRLVRRLLLNPPLAGAVAGLTLQARCRRSSSSRR